MMTVKDVVFDKSFLTVFFNEEESLIHLRWKGYATSEQFREGLMFALETVNSNQIENWLGNLKMMQMIQAADEEWTSRVWYPLITQSSLKKMAIVTSLDFLNNAAVRRIVNASADEISFETRYFVDVSDAHIWLTSLV